MKNFILLALLAICTAPAFAQTSIGIIGGYNHASLRSRNNTKASGLDVNPYAGWRAGIITDHHLFGKFHLQPQLLLNTKGHNIDVTSSDAVQYSFVYARRRFTYLELQTSLLFKQQTGAGKIFAGAGPYIGRGISGKDRYDEEWNGRRISNYYPIKYRDKEPIGAEADGVTYLKPYDIGVNFQAGYELKNGLFFNAVYSLGLNHIFHGHSSGNIDKNTYFGLSVGYFFKKFS
ncbi:PorT family protein [Chitinophaga filiformis]|uniref:outer membrane beta-barrel protein n=1 Tax=Chitinophaga filiformis TaxID=104663 RepID=UPI001F32BC6F|nr:outer membrane beta-barrel protein [Chitinophaga filiformis]MCF6402840.1 PorT family protein [Chitinophaga filiformis]MCF6403242.1 PorT family protein [Chitinophaga filiformis]